MMFWSSKSGINSKYSFSSSPTFTADPWSVYTGRPKSSNSSSSLSKVSIFMFDKKKYENYLLNYGIIKSKHSSHDKQLLEEGYNILRTQVSNLAKLKHPNILALIEPLEEHSKNFLFVTEYVTGSLESVFKSEDDEEQDFLRGHIKDDIIVHRGILQIVQGLEFIHNRATSVHLNIQPKSIFINENSDWKLSGLGHLIKLPQGTNTSEYFLPQYDPRIPQFMILNLNYTAPEIVFENTISCKNDYFSLGLLINFLYSGKNDIINAENSSSQYRSEYTKFERKISTMSWDNCFNKLPSKLQQLMPKLMNRDIYSRYDNITEFLDSEFFQDPLLKTINFLDDLPTKSTEEKLVFLEGLIQLLPQFPATLLQRKFLPILLELLSQLCSDKITDSRCISKDLEIILTVGSNLSQLTFQEKVFPTLNQKDRFKILLENATVTLIDNLEILKEKIKKSSFLDNILIPIMNYVLDKLEGENAVMPQEKLLFQVDILLETLDFPSVKKIFLPLLSKLFTKTTSLTVKTSCVGCFETLVKKKAIDGYTCSEEVLPLFRVMKTRDPRILSKSFELFECTPTIIKDEVVLVEQLLPLMWNYSMASTLRVSEYNKFTTSINKLTSDIQRQHVAKLNNKGDDLESMNSSKAFNKIIESQPVAKPKDLDNDASKKLGIPAIQPTRKTSSPVGNTKPSILTPKPRSTTFNATPSGPVAQPRQSILTPRKTAGAKPLVFTKGVANTSKRATTTSEQASNSYDDFADFVSSPSPSLAPAPVQETITTKNISDVTRNDKSLPPGFSASLLQPNRKA
ncbi:hypothetical protein KAFR_0C02170 [Kazachstania africana CBS 2517]|uniref:Protein kinase domain-containing protein n=1 Tax=Kazachstania africana (strain ATCC 22294 / BCRC 22015 / CBS 2517 / CECT 1963 / NBRC 1671 / NRRL Y-8276) TaxID=1071382 RepID=H2AS60_KAZAF|nr:hypothetical protein KAFR_0C02170 [Kazachstania africana CBS 2517]CCF57210.1 hypothetical protein KAFR_0C02170 [Kazachstania africana CBS 2517]